MRDRGFRMRRSRRGPKLALALGALLAVAGVTTAVVVAGLRGGDSSGPAAAEPVPEPPVEEVEAYLAAWSDGDWATMAALVDDPPDDFAAIHDDLVDSLRIVDARFAPGPVRLDPPPDDGVGATARDGADDAVPPRSTVPFAVTFELDGLGTWDYQSTLELVWGPGAGEGDGREDGGEGDGGEGDGDEGAGESDGGEPDASDEPGPPPAWRIAWSPATVHPELAAGFRLDRTRSWETRAPVLDGAGEVLVGAETVVEVGVEPRRIVERPPLDDALARHLDVDRGELDRALNAPGVGPDHFVPVTTVDLARWDEVRDDVLPVPGVVIRERAVRTGPPAPFASHVLGRVGEITAERLEQLGDPYRVGDVVGFTGVEATYEQRLAGTPAGEIRLRDPAGAIVGTLHEFPATRPEPVRLTIDPAIQAAAEQAVEGVADPVSLVAIEASTGRVLATVSRPADGFHRAIGGRYPPGSTFKVVTSLAALADGVTPSTVLPCPASIEIGGRTLRNFESSALGDVPFARAFTSSCNTAFIRAADDAGTDALATAAATMGFGPDYSVGLTTFPGSFPAVRDRAENAEAAIGQGRVEASPVHLASVAAAVASGTWRPPLLVEDPEPEDRPEPQALPPGTAETLRSLMLDAVRGGTGTRAAIAGRDIGGKTGTAQFDGANPGRTHALFIGFEGDVAVAVVVEEGGVGGQVAAPIAGRFFAALPR